MLTDYGVVASWDEFFAVIDREAARRPGDLFACPGCPLRTCYVGTNAEMKQHVTQVHLEKTQ